jgi:hypothetical protein
VVDTVSVDTAPSCLFVMCGRHSVCGHNPVLLISAEILCCNLHHCYSSYYIIAIFDPALVALLVSSVMGLSFVEFERRISNFGWSVGSVKPP